MVCSDPRQGCVPSFAFLIGFQVMLLSKAWGTHFGNRYGGVSTITAPENPELPPAQGPSEQMREGYSQL